MILSKYNTEIKTVPTGFSSDPPEGPDIPVQAIDIFVLNFFDIFLDII